MVTNTTDLIYGGKLPMFRGLSTDQKPTECLNGSEFLEMDTGKQFLYDGDSRSWIEDLRV